MNFFKVIILIASCLLFQNVLAQRMQKFEYGMGLGLTNYKGDVNPDIALRNVRVGINGFFRLNFKKGLSWRTGAVIGFLNGNDRQAGNPLNVNRGISFSSTFALAETVVEYHFFDFRKERSKYNFSPYIVGGLGVMYYSTEAKQNGVAIKDENEFPVHPVFPIGIGIKKLLYNESLYIGFEALTYKTLDDKLDNVHEKANDGFIQSFDTFYYFGINVSFRIINVTCPSPSVNF